MATAVDRPTEFRKPGFEEQGRRACRLGQFCIRTGEVYWMWVHYFIFFLRKRTPCEMGESEVREFLTHVAAERTGLASILEDSFAPRTAPFM